jgi:hypothetical protein
VLTADEAGGWRVDAAATGAARDAVRARRGRRARPVRDWYGDERRRILERRLSEPVSEMYRSSISLSTRWGGEFKQFWKLPADFEP